MLLLHINYSIGTVRLLRAVFKNMINRAIITCLAAKMLEMCAATKMLSSSFAFARIILFIVISIFFHVIRPNMKWMGMQ